MASSLMRVLLAFAVFGKSAASTGPNVAYFRNHNMDRSLKLNAVSADASSVILNEWDTTINIFDTVKDVKVQRIDITGTAGATVSVYSKAAPLHLTEGPMYIFHNATKLVINDNAGHSYSAAKTDAVSWMSKGSCLYFSAELSSDGEASLIAVTSGNVNWTISDSLSKACDTATVLVGAGIQLSGGSNPKGWVYNEVDYTLTNSDSCTTPLTHGANGYSQTDEPIGPLDAHYHTRGALYYNQFGTSKYNDEAAPNDTLYQGELRFVNAGVHYGPEEMASPSSGEVFVASVHESDPAALNPVNENPDSECPFACMNTLGGKSPARCTKAAAGATKVLV